MEERTFLVDGIGDEWAQWSLQFAQLWSSQHASEFFHDRCIEFLEGSESLASAFSSLVPSSVSEETFWCRYLLARRCILPHEHALFILENDPATFSFEPIETDFHVWKGLFSGEWDHNDPQMISDCTVALEKSQLLSWQYKRLVPADVSARDFWCRYLFRRALLARKESNDEVSLPSSMSPTLSNEHTSLAREVGDDGLCAESSSQVVSAIDDVASSLSHSIASTSGDASPPGSVATPTIEQHSSHGRISSSLGVQSSSIAESATPATHTTHSSSHVSVQGTSSLEVAGWDEWE